MTTGAIDSAACRLFIESSTIITTYSRAQPASKPPHLHGVKKRHWGDSQSRETGNNDGFCRRGEIRGNVRKDRRKEADWKETARTMANDKIAAEKINKMDAGGRRR